MADYAYASEINETEAEKADALFDCECCFGSVAFEGMVTCDESCHQLCFDCVRRTVNEALYGQGWARTAHHERNTVRCFAPTSQECHGGLPADRVRHALSDGHSNTDIWQEFQSRLASEALIKSKLQLHRCPFCTYAEVDEVPAMRVKVRVCTFNFDSQNNGARILWLVASIQLEDGMISRGHTLLQPNTAALRILIGQKEGE